jgi:hypothetical protein
MRRRLTFGILLLAALSLAVTTSAGKPPAVKEIPVAVTFMDGIGYAIQSDNHTSYANGQQGVRAVLVSAGNLALDTDYSRSSIVRKVSLDFSVCAVVSPIPCDPPVVDKVVAFVSTSSCTSWALRDMPKGETQSCNLNVNFPAEGLGWFIRFGEYAGTTPATVDRLADGSWTIDVHADGVARLQSYPTNGRMVLTDKGDFVMPVQLTVTLQ